MTPLKIVSAACVVVADLDCVQKSMSLHAYWTHPFLANATGKRMEMRTEERCIVDSVEFDRRRKDSMFGDC